MLPLKNKVHILIYFFVFVLTGVVSPFFGSSDISLTNIITDHESADYLILVYQRIPRIITGLLCGAGLGCCGACLQVILKNPLAEPYVLGISGISSLFLSFSIIVLNGLIPSGIASLAGALLAVFIIDFSFRAFKSDSDSTILAGVSLNILSASLIMFLKYFASPNKLVAVERWFMGNLDVIGYDNLIWLFVICVCGILLIFFKSEELNIMGFDISLAVSRGVDPAKIRRIIYFAAGLITAGVVWIAGPVGFVGLIIPHIVKNFSGSEMKTVILGSSFLGGGFLCICDIFSRVLIAPAELPVGIITSISGAPVFLYILFKMKKKK
ncbi:MAG: iron ABC transporter permease [Desulfobacteraceae bacterium]|nr:iron ABC transporter permease [Desulfobacteraceae bacterium]